MSLNIMTLSARKPIGNATPIESVPHVDGIDADSVRAGVERVLQRGDAWATPDESAAILSGAGIPVAITRTAVTLEEALAAAEQIGYPVALKASGPALLHKTERAAVALNITVAMERKARSGRNWA